MFIEFLKVLQKFFKWMEVFERFRWSLKGLYRSLEIFLGPIDSVPVGLEGEPVVMKRSISP